LGVFCFMKLETSFVSYFDKALILMKNISFWCQPQFSGNHLFVFQCKTTLEPIYGYIGLLASDHHKSVMIYLPKQTILEHLWMNVNIFFIPLKKKGGWKGRWKIFLIWRLSRVDCESISSSSLYTSQSSPPSFYLWNPSAQIPWLSFWWLNNFFSSHVPFPNNDNKMDHNPQQPTQPQQEETSSLTSL